MSHSSRDDDGTDASTRLEPHGESSSEHRLSWVALASVPEEIEATLAAGFLENEGVPCLVESKFFSQEPTNLSVLGEFVLHVHEDAVPRARRLLEDRLDLSLHEPEGKSLESLLDQENETD